METIIQDISNALIPIPNINITIDKEVNIISLRENNKLIAEINVTYSSERNIYFSFIPNTLYRASLQSYTAFKKELFINNINKQLSIRN